MLKKMKSFLIPILLVFSIFFTFLYPKLIFKDILEALTIFIHQLFPAMFFFYTLSDLFINYGFVSILEKLFNRIFLVLFHLSGTSSFIIFMSILSGFPSGAKYISQFVQDKLITRSQAHYLLTFTHFSNPLFIMGTIALLYGKKFALIVLFCHYLANFILAILIRPKEVAIECIPPKIQKKTLSLTLSESFMNSFKILFLILGNTIFFFTFSDIFTVFIQNPLIQSILYGICDLTKGILSVQHLPITLFCQALLITSFLSFGGISVHFQVKEIIEKEKLNYRYFLLGRISSLAISIFLLIICFTIRII